MLGELRTLQPAAYLNKGHNNDFGRGFLLIEGFSPAGAWDEARAAVSEAEATAPACADGLMTGLWGTRPAGARVVPSGVGG